MLHSKSFYKSTPCIAASSSANGPHKLSQNSNRIQSNIHRSVNQIIGRDELEERYLDLRDQNQLIRREAHAAQKEVQQLHVKLQRLVEEKKRYFKHRKTDREIVLEEQIFELEQQLHKQIRQNDRLRDRIQLMRVQGEQGQDIKVLAPSSTVRVSSAYAHVQARTDSGLLYQQR